MLLRPQWRQAIAENSIFLSKVALLSANHVRVGYIFHVLESIQIANWNTSVIITNKNLTMVHILHWVMYCFRIFSKYILL